MFFLRYPQHWLSKTWEMPRNGLQIWMVVSHSSWAVKYWLIGRLVITGCPPSPDRAWCVCVLKIGKWLEQMPTPFFRIIIAVFIENLIAEFGRLVQAFPTSTTCSTIFGIMIPNDKHIEVGWRHQWPCSRRVRGPCALPCHPAMASLWWRWLCMVGIWFVCAAAPNQRRNLRRFGCITAWFPGYKWEIHHEKMGHSPVISEIHSMGNSPCVFFVRWWTNMAPGNLKKWALGQITLGSGSTWPSCEGQNTGADLRGLVIPMQKVFMCIYYIYIYIIYIYIYHIYIYISHYIYIYIYIIISIIIYIWVHM